MKGGTFLDVSQAWQVALQYAERWVAEAEKQALRVHGTRTEWEHRIESEAAAGYMGIARGAISTLEIFRPGDDQVAELRRRLNRCPILRLVGSTKEAG